MTAATGQLDRGHWRILAHYANGTQLSAIAVICGVTYAEVVDLIETKTGFDRSRAAALLRPGDRPQPASPKRKRQDTATPPIRPIGLVRRTQRPTPAPVEQPKAPLTGVPEEQADWEGQEPERRVEPAPDPEPDSQPEPAAAGRVRNPLAPPPPVHGQRLRWWDEFECLTCHHHSFLQGPCCNAEMVPVTVTVTYREVGA